MKIAATIIMVVMVAAYGCGTASSSGGGGSSGGGTGNDNNQNQNETAKLTLTLDGIQPSQADIYCSGESTPWQEYNQDVEIEAKAQTYFCNVEFKDQSWYLQSDNTACAGIDLKANGVTIRTSQTNNSGLRNLAFQLKADSRVEPIGQDVTLVDCSEDPGDPDPGDGDTVDPGDGDTVDPGGCYNIVLPITFIGYGDTQTPKVGCFGEKNEDGLAWSEKAVNEQGKVNFNACPWGFPAYYFCYVEIRPGQWSPTNNGAFENHEFWVYETEIIKASPNFSGGQNYSFEVWDEEPFIEQWGNTLQFIPVDGNTTGLGDGGTIDIGIDF